jgi:multiple sugar transport system ATP-binding protein
MAQAKAAPSTSAGEPASPPASQPAIELRGIGKHFGKTRVIESIDLEIRTGELCVFVGPSGCGKSTLLRIIAGLEEATSGDLLIGGRRMNNVESSQRGIAMVFQSYALYPHMTVRENLAFGLRADKEEAAKRIGEAAKMLQIDHLLGRLPRELSGGQRQRVAIGRAITRQPKIFLFDEPLSNLDAALRVTMRTELARLHKQLGSTMVYVTHDQVEAMTMADKIVVLNGGHIEQAGTPLEVYGRPRTLFAAGFLGSPQMNFLPGKITDRMAEGVVVELEGGGSVRAQVKADGASVGDAVTVGIRPEHVRLLTGEDGPLAGKVTMIEDVGDHAIVHIEREAGGGRVLARVERPPVAEGAQVRYAMPPAECHVFDANGMALPKPVTRPA